MNVRERLENLADLQYRQFSSKLVPGSDMLGVRLPELRKIAREIAAQDWRVYLKEAREDYFEEVMLQGMVLGYIQKAPAQEILDYASAFVPKIRNWSVNDSFCATFSLAEREPELVWNWLEGYRNSEREFEQRMCAVMLMDHYLREEWIDHVLDWLGQIRPRFYYARMAVAWAAATAYAQFPEKTENFKRKLDAETKRLMEQKMLESRRIAPEVKEKIRQERKTGHKINERI